MGQEDGGGPGREAGPPAFRGRRQTLGDVVGAGLAEFGPTAGKTKVQCLKALLEDPIAAMRGSDIRAHHVVDLIRRLGQTRRPQTVPNHLWHLSTVFALSRSLSVASSAFDRACSGCA